MKNLKYYISKSEQRENSILHRGLINANRFYAELNKLPGDTKKIHDEYYSKAYYNSTNKMILQYCEGDLTVEVFENEKDLNNEIENTIKWFEKYA